MGLIVRERQRLLAALGRLPVTAWPSQANFILFRPEHRKGAEVWQGLARPFGPGPGHLVVAAAGRLPAGHRRHSRGERRLPRRAGGGAGMTPPAWSAPAAPDEGDHHRGQPAPRRVGAGGGGDRAAVLRPHGGPARQARRLRPDPAGPGDLEVDAHHTVEDVGILLGECLREALGDKAGVRRFASIDVPLDEALISVALDLSGPAVPGVRGRPGRRRRGLPARLAAASTRSWPRSSGGRW